MALFAAEYRPRHPQDSDYYHCVEDYFEAFVQGYDEQFSRQYGFWQPNIEKVIYYYLSCGDLYQWLCPCDMERLPSYRFPVSAATSAPPATKSGRVRGMALHGCP